MKSRLAFQNWKVKSTICVMSSSLVSWNVREAFKGENSALGVWGFPFQFVHWKLSAAWNAEIDYSHHNQKFHRFPFDDFPGTHSWWNCHTTETAVLRSIRAPTRFTPRIHQARHSCACCESGNGCHRPRGISRKSTSILVSKKCYSYHWMQLH